MSFGIYTSLLFAIGIHILRADRHMWYRWVQIKR